MVRTAPAAGSVEAWLRQLPGPMSSDSPQNVLRKAHERYSQSCPEPVEYGAFVDHLWNRGIQPEQAGTHFWLKIAGVIRGGAGHSH